jgi:hypothetical protein
MSKVNIKLNPAEYTTRDQLFKGDYFEFDSSIWICINYQGGDNDSIVRSNLAVDLSDGTVFELKDDELKRVKIVDITSRGE